MLIESKPGAGEAPGLLLSPRLSNQTLDNINLNAMMPKQAPHQFPARP
jgi:hypothetical protein